MTPDFSMNAIQKDFPKFVKQVKARLMAGAESYGDISFSRSPEELIDEIVQELLDVNGWSWILYHRLMVAKKALQNAKNKTTP